MPLSRISADATSLLRGLASLAFWLVAALHTLFFSSVIFVVGLALAPVDRSRRVAQALVTVWGHGLVILHPRWRVRTLHRERLQGGPFVICANHQSFADTLALSALHGHWKWVAKSSVFLVPFMGWGMWAVGYVGVRRGKKESAERMIQDCRRWLARGASVLIFPEGTRSPDGALGPVKHGAFTLALASGANVLPIAVDGTRHAIEKGGFDVTGPAAMVVSVLPPIDVAPFREGDAPEGLKAATREAIGAELARLRERS